MARLTTTLLALLVFCVTLTWYLQNKSLSDYSNQDTSGSNSIPQLRSPASVSVSVPSLGEKTQQQTLSLEWAKENSRKVGKWRKALTRAVKKNDTALIQELTTNTFRVWSDESPIVPCEYIFLDFGSNMGDSLRKFVDSSLPMVNQKQPALDVASGSVGKDCYGCGDKKYKWIMQRFVLGHLKKKNPEDYCFYGVEGNPHFTGRLREIEATVMSMRPRPVRHVHFLTEHVGAGKDGPTTLYLDTINTKDHFWGSSVYQSHVDVAKSGNDTGVSVMGITLTTLLRRTLLSGGHAIIKIDIEGGEYPMMEEALESNILCEMVNKLNSSISIVMEPHHKNKMGTQNPETHWIQIQGEDRIKRCGVFLRVGDAGR